ncbi:MAG: hypothetical protein K2O96_04765 [Lachnospiraceae bacterium]|nr:hypothetical protein [Lachnospiraceae bacterium]
MSPEEVEDNIKKKKAKKFKCIYKYDKENLDLMFANIDDSTQTMEAIISYIMSGQGRFNLVCYKNCFPLCNPPNIFPYNFNNTG